MIDPEIRLRRAIHLRDLTLVKRIIKWNLAGIRNPDFEDGNNSSLHIAAVIGDADLVRFLIDAGHENEGISKNTDGNTPLLAAINHEQEETAAILARAFPRCIEWKNDLGLDALMLSSLHGLSTTTNLILSLHPSPLSLLSSTDIDGNTPLHFAAGYGQPACLRILLSAGADPMVENNFRCTPAMGFRSKEASTYFLSLVRDIEVRKLSDREREKEVLRQRAGGVRVVSGSEEGSIGQAVSMVGSSEGGDEDREENAGLGLEAPPPLSRAAVFGTVDSGRQSPAGRMRRWEAFGSANRSRAGSYDQ